VNQDLTVSSSAATKGGIATGGSATIDQSNVGGQSFTAFKLPANVKLEFSGKLAVVNLPATTLLAGELNFKDPQGFGFLNTGSGALTITPTGKLTADALSIIAISGTAGTLTNNGQISAAGLVLYRPGTAALTFKTTGQTDSLAGVYIDPQSSGSSTITFNVTGGTSTDHFVFQHIPLPTMYTANAQTTAANAAKLPNVALTFSMTDGSSNPIEARLDGVLNAGTLTVKGVAATFNKLTSQTPITIETGANFRVATTMKISSTGFLNIRDADLTAGTLAPNTDLSAPITASSILTKGSITLSSTGTAGIAFTHGATITNNGALLQVTASGAGANIDLGNTNKFFDNGGNVSLLAKGSVGGDGNNAFNAVGIVNTASGGIEIGAGTTTSSLSKALGSKPTSPLPSITGAIITPNATGKQVLLLPSGTTGITLGGTGNESSIDFSKQGAMVFNAVGGATISLSRATFTTVSSKPVSLQQAAEREVEEFIVDTDEDAPEFELVKVSR
jgi:hypothetical protein